MSAATPDHESLTDAVALIAVCKGSVALAEVALSLQVVAAGVTEVPEEARKNRIFARVHRRITNPAWLAAARAALGNEGLGRVGACFREGCFQYATPKTARGATSDGGASCGVGDPDRVDRYWVSFGATVGCLSGFWSREPKLAADPQFSIAAKKMLEAPRGFEVASALLQDPVLRTASQTMMMRWHAVAGGGVSSDGLREAMAPRTRSWWSGLTRCCERRAPSCRRSSSQTRRRQRRLRARRHRSLRQPSRPSRWPSPHPSRAA